MQRRHELRIIAERFLKLFQVTGSGGFYLILSDPIFNEVIEDFVDRLYQFVTIGWIGNRKGHEDSRSIDRFRHEVASNSIR